MKKAKKILSIFFVICMLITACAVSSSAASESSYKATFTLKYSVERGGETISSGASSVPANVKAGDLIKITTNLKTNYYVSATQWQIYFSRNLFEPVGTFAQSNSWVSTQLKSYCNLNGNIWDYVVDNSKDNFYPATWSAAKKTEFSYVHFSVAPLMSLGKPAQKISEDVAVVTLRVKANAPDAQGSIMMSTDAIKTSSNPTNPTSCARFETSSLSSKITGIGQTFDLSGAKLTVNVGNSGQSLNLFQKIAVFFQRIFDWFASLFK